MHIKNVLNKNKLIPLVVFALGLLLQDRVFQNLMSISSDKSSLYLSVALGCVVGLFIFGIILWALEKVEEPTNLSQEVWKDVSISVFLIAVSILVLIQTNKFSIKPSGEIFDAVILMVFGSIASFILRAWFDKKVFNKNLDNFPIYILAFWLFLGFIVAGLDVKEILPMKFWGTIVMIISLSILIFTIVYVYSLIKKYQVFLIRYFGILFLLALGFQGFFQMGSVIKYSVIYPFLINNLSFSNVSQSINGSFFATVVSVSFLSTGLYLVIKRFSLIEQFVIQVIVSSILLLLFRRNLRFFILSPVLVQMILSLYYIFSQKGKIDGFNWLKKIFGPFPVNVLIYIMIILEYIVLSLFVETKGSYGQFSITSVGILISFAVILVLLWRGYKVGYYLQWIISGGILVIGILMILGVLDALITVESFIIISFAMYELLVNYKKAYGIKSKVKKRKRTKKFVDKEHTIWGCVFENKYKKIFMVMLLLLSVGIVWYATYIGYYRNRAPVRILWESDEAVNIYDVIFTGGEVVYVQKVYDKPKTILCKNSKTGETLWYREIDVGYDVKLFKFDSQTLMLVEAQDALRSGLIGLEISKIDIKTGEVLSEKEYEFEDHKDSVRRYSLENGILNTSSGELNLIEVGYGNFLDDKKIDYLSLDIRGGKIEENALEVRNSRIYDFSSYIIKVLDGIVIKTKTEDKIYISYLTENMQKVGPTSFIGTEEIDYFLDAVSLTDYIAFYETYRDSKVKGNKLFLYEKNTLSYEKSITFRKGILNCYQQEDYLYCITKESESKKYLEKVNLKTGEKEFKRLTDFRRFYLSTDIEIITLKRNNFLISTGSQIVAFEVE